MNILFLIFWGSITGFRECISFPPLHRYLVSSEILLLFRKSGCQRMNHRSLTAEAAAQLRDGISLVLSRWAALRMAIENEWGGRDSNQKSQQLGDSLFNLLTQSKGTLHNYLLEWFIAGICTIIHYENIIWIWPLFFCLIEIWRLINLAVCIKK